MGKHRHIDHRQPPREAGIPKIIREGKPVAYAPEPEDPNDPLLIARRRITELEGSLELAQQKERTSKAEAAALKNVLHEAREESLHLRQQAQAKDDEGVTAERIEIVTVDNITRSGDTATVTALCDVDGHVDEAQVIVPVSLIKSLIQKKRKPNGQSARTEGVLPEVRRPAEGGDVSDEPGDAAVASGAALRKVRDPSPSGDAQ